MTLESLNVQKEGAVLFAEISAPPMNLFEESVRNPETQKRIEAAIKRGFQTRAAEMDLARLIGDLADH